MATFSDRVAHKFAVAFNAQLNPEPDAHCQDGDRLGFDGIVRLKNGSFELVEGERGRRSEAPNDEVLCDAPDLFDGREVRGVRRPFPKVLDVVVVQPLQC